MLDPAAITEDPAAITEDPAAITEDHQAKVLWVSLQIL